MDNINIDITDNGDNVVVTISQGITTVWADQITITGTGTYGDPLVGIAGAADMLKAVYDPTNVNGDAFDMENMVEGATKKILTSAERTKLSNLSGTNTGDQDLSGLVPYTGATADVNLGVHGIVTDTVRGVTSAGLLLESANGTDIGLSGVGNSANMLWYGAHNFSLATQDTIAAFTGAGKTLGSLATATYPSLTELSYVKGVTSDVQSQLNAKVPTSRNITINGVTQDLSADRTWTIASGTVYGGNNTLYVSKQGNDGTGTKGDRSKPYLTIQAAINAATAGDVVLVMEGTYTENIALKDYVKLIAETWGAVTIRHAGTVNSFGISSPSVTVLGSGVYYEIFIWGFRIENTTAETTIKINAEKLYVAVPYMEIKSKNVTYQSKITLYYSSSSVGMFEADVIDVKAISTTVQFGFDGGGAGAPITSTPAIPTCHIKVLNFTEAGATPQDYIGWQNWNWKVDAVNSNTINASNGFGEIYHQNCSGHIGIYRSIRTGAQGNNNNVIYIASGNQTLRIDYFYSAGQERVFSINDAQGTIDIGWMEIDGLIFITPGAGKELIINAGTLKRINAKSTSIFYIFPTGAGASVYLNCDYCESNGSGAGTIYTFNSSNVVTDIYLKGEFYNSNATNSLVIKDDAVATIKYKVNGSVILRNNQSAATKFYGSFDYNRNLYIVGGMGTTQGATGAGVVTTVVGAIVTDTGL